jgi:hypothetical protein
MRYRNLLVPVVALVSVFAAANPVRADGVDLCGRWRGCWVSCDGHDGKLNAQFCKISDNCYRVRFTGTFCVCLPFCYSVNLEVVEVKGDTVVLYGCTDLPLFGTFRMHAIATPCEIDARYFSGDDEGRFKLSR